jgi:hypothetical protein
MVHSLRGDFDILSNYILLVTDDAQEMLLGLNEGLFEFGNICGRRTLSWQLIVGARFWRSLKYKYHLVIFLFGRQHEVNAKVVSDFGRNLAV